MTFVWLSTALSPLFLFGEGGCRHKIYLWSVLPSLNEAIFSFSFIRERISIPLASFSNDCHLQGLFCPWNEFQMDLESWIFKIDLQIKRHTTTTPSPPPSLFAICAQENSKVSPLYPLVFSARNSRSKCQKKYSMNLVAIFLFLGGTLLAKQTNTILQSSSQSQLLMQRTSVKFLL